MGGGGSRMRMHTHQNIHNIVRHEKWLRSARHAVDAVLHLDLALDDPRHHPLVLVLRHPVLHVAHLPPHPRAQRARFTPREVVRTAWGPRGQGGSKRRRRR